MTRKYTAFWNALLLAVVTAFLCQGSAMFAAEPITVRSQSGQFLVRGLPLGIPVARYSTSAVPYLRLDPTLTAVSLDRIRQTIQTELKLPNEWRGLITVMVRPVTEDDPPARITSVHYKDGWGYKLELPERMDKDRFLRVAVRSILLEIANRGAVIREAELPPWLVEGLATELETTSLSTLALEPDTQVARREQNPDVLRSVRSLLRQQPALTFDQLSMLSEEEVSGETSTLYRTCAHLFVHELMRLRNGRESLGKMLQHLHKNLNWQTTFLHAFQKYFPGLIDADKWYALTVATISGREQMSVWPREVTGAQLDEILSTSVQVRLAPGELPVQTTVTLQQILKEWERTQQAPVINQKLDRLRALRQRSSPDYAALIDGYSDVLFSYSIGRPSVRTAGLFRSRSGVKSVVEQLNDLDAKRVSLRQHSAERR